MVQSYHIFKRLSIIPHNFIILNRTIASNLVIITIFIIKQQFNCYKSIIFLSHLDKSSAWYRNDVDSCGFLQSVSLFWNYVYCFSTIFISNSKKQKNRRNHTNFFGFFQLISRLNSIFHHVFTKASLFLHIKLLIFTWQFLIYS